MPIMQDTWYLPEEVIKYRNYPEVRSIEDNLGVIQAYAKRVGNAIDDYNSGTFDKIDINIVDLRNTIDLCRSVAKTLGEAPNVCYDLLLEVRELQDIFQTLMYTYNRFGSQFIGTPSDPTADTNPDVI